MLFTGYMDESDTHGSAPDITMSAMLSTTGRWERCDRAYARVRKSFGFELFHATDFRSLRGEFENWSLQMCESLLEELGQLGFDHLTECFTVHCKYETYKTHFLDKKPAKMPRASQYGICFMGALDSMMRVILQQGTQHKLSIIVEDGHNNAPDTARLFKDRKDRLERGGIGMLLSHTLAGKKDVPLLQLADVTAYGHTLERRSIDSGYAAPFSERPAEEVQDHQPGWTIVEITPEYLSALIGNTKLIGLRLRKNILRGNALGLDAKGASDG